MEDLRLTSQSSQVTIAGEMEHLELTSQSSQATVTGAMGSLNMRDVGLGSSSSSLPLPNTETTIKIGSNVVSEIGRITDLPVSAQTRTVSDLPDSSIHANI
jgi:hypothetical protein